MAKGARLLYFNSTMVRLKRLIHAVSVFHLDAFQFHNGSIKARIRLIAVALRSSFQFHNGSIKAMVLEQDGERKYKFQFHNGSIKAVLAIPPRVLFSPISIPQWFD